MGVHRMTSFRKVFGRTLIVLIVGLLVGLPSIAVGAMDLPLATNSPTAGITFDDRPLMLSVQRNFQMAMLTASSELGRSCGHMEAYGWRMGANEQKRVNQIFNNTVDRLRAQGYGVESQSPNSVSRDVTIFTADRSDKHLIFMWSAGEIGLVMVLCETSAPLAPTAYSSPAPAHMTTPVRPLEMSQALRGGTGPVPLTLAGKRQYADFSPVGEWVGNYTCMQGTTGAMLKVSNVKGDQFEGTFKFYPTTKNPYVPSGEYKVFGEYDRDSQRILVNPGQWIQRPKNYFNTIMIGSFDPVARTFSGFFQGISGCTSFEARYDENSVQAVSVKKIQKTKVHKKTKKKTKKRKIVKKDSKPVIVKPTTPDSGEKSDSSGSGVDIPAGIDLGQKTVLPDAPPSPGSTDQNGFVPLPDKPNP